MSKTRDLANLADLNFDSGTMVVDKVNDRVGVLNATPAHPFQVGTDDLIVDASGNLLVGTTSTPSTLISATSGGGIALDPNSFSAWNREATASNHSHLVFNQTGVDAQYLQFRKDGTTVGSIGTVSGKIYIGSSAGGDTFLRLNSNTVTPANSSGADRDATINLGYSGGRFQNLFLSGGVYLGGTGSANKLDDYEEGTWTPTVSGRTFSSSKGHYTKVGNLVFIHFECEAISSAISDPLIGGLPFTASPPTGSPADYSSYISCDEVSSWTLSSGYTNIYFRVGAGVTTLQALQSTGETHSSGTSWGTNGNVRASGFYYTNS